MDTSIIGTRLRSLRLQKGLYQGDIEKSTGLLRCYLSRIENGHTMPSLPSLAKIALAMDIGLVEFFGGQQPATLDHEVLTLDGADIEFLTQIHRHSAQLTKRERGWLLEMVKSFASGLKN
jgi:transcriptional regulator with XRE-family HTH domain